MASQARIFKMQGRVRPQVYIAITDRMNMARKATTDGSSIRGPWRKLRLNFAIAIFCFQRISSLVMGSGNHLTKYHQTIGFQEASFERSFELSLSIVGAILEVSVFGSQRRLHHYRYNSPHSYRAGFCLLAPSGHTCRFCRAF